MASPKSPGPWKVHPHVVFRQQDDVCKIIHLDRPSSKIFVLKDSGYHIWKAIIAGGDWIIIVSNLEAFYGPRSEIDLQLVATFIEELCAQEFIVAPVEPG